MIHPETCQNLVLIQEPGNGFIHQSSQIGAGAVNCLARPNPQRSKEQAGNPTQVEARGVNHMEMGTHPETERILREAWDGVHGNPKGSGNPFFISR